MKTLIAILCLLSLPFCVQGAPNKKELVITAEPMWAVEASAKGHFIKEDELITVVFETVTLSRTARDGVYNGDVFVEGVQIGLATAGDSGWEVKLWGGMLFVNQTISTGQSLNFSDFSTSIAVDDVEDLSNSWFVLKVDTAMFEGQHGTTYSHSPRGLITED